MTAKLMCFKCRSPKATCSCPKPIPTCAKCAEYIEVARKQQEYVRATGERIQTCLDLFTRYILEQSASTKKLEADLKSKLRGP